jgi:hypothetical protein
VGGGGNVGRDGVDMVETMAVVMTMAMVDQLQSVTKKNMTKTRNSKQSNTRPALDTTETTENSTSPN